MQGNATGSFGLRAEQNGVVTVTGGTASSASSALFAQSGGTINATNLNATARGANAIGANANNGTIRMTGGSLTTTSGALNHGFNASGATGRIEADGVTVTSVGNGLRVANTGSFGQFNNGTINSTAAGVVAAASGATATLSNSSITTTGLNAHGVQAIGGQVSLTGGSVRTTNTTSTGSGATGLRAESGGTINTLGTDITTLGITSHGVVAETDGIVNLNGSATDPTNVTVSNGNARGFVTTSGTINAAHTRLASAGHGAIAQGTGVINFDEDTAIAAASSNKVGVGISNGGTVNILKPMTVTMSGGAFSGQTGIYVHDGSQLSVPNGLTIVGGGRTTARSPGSRSIIPLSPRRSTTSI